MEWILPWFEFDKVNADPETGIAGSARDAHTKDGGAIICRACSSVITNRADRIEIQGSHAHRRTNPGGFSYDFGCFSDAPGCAVAGNMSREHTWFAGHAWQVATCAGCGEHLGWLFTGAASFFGLILARLAEDGSKSV